MRILHTADWHMGVKTHGRYNSTHGLNQRLIDVARQVHAIKDTAEAEAADMILFAGDAFDNSTPPPTQQRLLYDAITELSAVAPIHMIPGNHDHPVSEGLKHAFDLFREIEDVWVHDRPGSQPVAEDGCPAKTMQNAAIQLTHLPWPLSHFAGPDEDLRELYASTIEDAAETDLPHVVTGHFTVNGSLPAGSESAMSMSREITFGVPELSAADYVGLGHIHKHQNLAASAQDTPIVYCGSPERLSFGEENDPKGVVVFDTDYPTSYEFVELPARRYVTVEEDLAGVDAPTKELVRRISDYDVTDAVVRVRYASETAIDESQVFDVLEGAYTVDAIDRQHDEVERSTRSNGVEADADVDDLVSTYADSRDISADQTERMLAMADDL